MTDIVSRHAKEAVKQFAGSVTVPIMQPLAGDILPVGTGTFLSFQDRLFIITAAHLFDGQSLDRFYVPSARTDGKAVKLIGTIVRAKDHKRVDVAVIEILDEGTKARLLQGWQSITLDDVWTASDLGTFVLVGYPTEYQHANGDTFEFGVCTTLTTRISPPSNAQMVDDSIDLFFKYAEVAVDEDGDTLLTPHLRGASGASIWEFREPDGDGLWTVENSAKVVGVQASAMDGEWFRATSWDVIKDALAYKDEQLRAAVEGQ